MTTFFGFFVFYLVLGVVMTAVLFYWAVRNDQFRDQQRARYLPLEGVEPAPSAPRQRWPKEIVITIIVAFLGVGSLLGLVLYVALTE